jgi:hypothetical protein
MGCFASASVIGSRLDLARIAAVLCAGDAMQIKARPMHICRSACKAVVVFQSGGVCHVSRAGQLEHGLSDISVLRSGRP